MKTQDNNLILRIGNIGIAIVSNRSLDRIKTQTIFITRLIDRKGKIEYNKPEDVYESHRPKKRVLSK